MYQRHQEEIPESTLVDDDKPSRNYRSRYANKPPKNDNIRSNEGTRYGMAQEPTATPNQSKGTPSYLLSRGEKERVDVDNNTLVSLGKTNTNKWNPSTHIRQGAIQGGQSISTPAKRSFADYSVKASTTKTKSDEQKQANTQKTEGTSQNPSYNPFLESPEPHPQQLRPSIPLYGLAQTLFKRDPMTWTIDDVHTPQSSDGTSILVSAFMDYATTTLKPDMSPTECVQLAQTAVATAPQFLLEYIQDYSKGKEFVLQTEHTKAPPSFEKHLCPASTPGLIADSHLRRNLIGKDIIRTEMIEVIETFTKCYYPKQAATTRDFLKTVTMQVLQDYIYKPGYFATDLENKSRQMNFSPPKWYRLSIHPGTTIQATPRRQISWQSIPISLSDVELNLEIDKNLLIQQPFTAQRTTLLTAIPLIFDNRPTRDGCMETLALVENATPEELYTFLTKDMFPPPNQHTENNNESENTQETHNESLYCVRFEHADHKKTGFWNESPGAVLIRWLQAVIPVLIDNNFTLTLTQAPYERSTNDRKILPNFSATTEQMEEFTHNCKSSSKLSSFEVWMKSTCWNLNDLLMVSKSGEKAKGYIQRMKSARIWLETISQTTDGMVPVIMLGGSIESEPDDMIGAELNDRLILANTTLSNCPNFNVGYCAVNTSSNKGGVMAKCIIANKSQAETLHNIFNNMVTPGMQERHLVTRDYFFAPISYPPNDRSDRELSKAMNRQRSFMDSIIQTTILGLIDVDPFITIPTNTKDFCTGEVAANEKSLVELLLLSKTRDTTDSVISSPVRKVSTNNGKNRLHLTALKTDTENLIAFTKRVARTLDTWFPGHKMRPRCDFEAANEYMETSLAEQASNIQSMIPSTLGNRWQSESSIQTQRQLERAGNTEELTATAKKGIRETFKESTTIDEPNTNNAGIMKREITPPEQATPGSHVQNELKQEIAELKDEINAIRLLIQGQETRPKQISDDEMASTISTMVETNIQSSLTSTAKLVAHCEHQLIEQTRMMTDFIAHFSQRLTDIDTRIKDSSKTETDLERLIHQQGDFISIATEELRAMKSGHQQLIVAIGKQNQTEPEDTNDQVEFTPAGPDETPPPDSPETTKIQEDHREQKNHKIRARAVGIISMMKTMPFKATPESWEDEYEEEGSQEHEHPHIDGTTTKNTCAVCKCADLGLIYCDRCPEEATEVYHPTCLTFLRKSTERICQKCTTDIQPEGGNEGKKEITQTAFPAKTPEEDKTQPNDAEIPVPNKEEEPTDIGSDSSTQESSDSPTSEDSFPPPRQTMKSQHITTQNTIPPYLNRNTNDTDTTQLQHQTDPMIASPIKTRAARKAANTTSQESASDTDADSEHYNK